ncbi:hypothetical protein A9Q84_20640 [Halobacteriovorax marinus]|uniref:Uncharacterized protein n=1 Tax=Halobacteriovorax marinus TaxID=97084 RepID=A0A1Y5F6Q5_9BACT|nr:hypothetical protein A9Q84_20640 [Halobacteriovorax marinus]
MENTKIINQEFNAPAQKQEQALADNMPTEDVIVNENGQAFIEFLFILLAMVLISFGMLKGINGSISLRWLGTVKAIAKPTPSNIELRR